jgi:hypothetical protein
MYMVGGHTANLVIDEEFRCFRQGLPVLQPPTVSSGAGAINQIAYLRPYDEVTGERGPLSEGTEFTGDLNRSWTAIPTEIPTEIVIIEGLVTFAAGTVTGTNGKANFDQLRPGDRVAKATDLTRWGRVRTLASSNSMVIDDTAIAGAGVELVAKTVSRVSHIELWLSVSGALPRFIMRVRIGTTSVTESTATLALGEAETTSFQALPYGTINAFYNNRQIVAGVEGHLNTLFLSPVGFPERDEGLRLQTRYGEPIVGLLLYRTVVIVITPKSLYVTQGFTDEDFELQPLDPKIGGMGHHCNWVDEDGIAYIPSKKGVTVWNGAPHDGLPTRRSEWVSDFVANRLAYQLGFAAYNENDGTGQFYPRHKNLSNPNRKAYVWVANGGVGPSPDGGVLLPEWTSDSHRCDAEVSSSVVTYAAYLEPAGSASGKFYRCTNDGKIFEEDEAGTVALHVDSIVAFFHNEVGDFGGDKTKEGKEWIRFWFYLRSEQSMHSLRVWVGDEYCYPPDVLDNGETNTQTAAMKDDNRPATLITAGRKTTAAETVHALKGGKQGRGHTAEIRLHNPLNGIIMGYGGEYGPGDTSRKLYSDYPDPG